MILRFASMLVLVVGLFASGCQGTGEMINFDLEAVSSKSQTSEAYHDDTLRISVNAFEDHRSQKDKFGTRTHLWGGTTSFNTWNGNVGEGMADLAVAYLKQRKWQAGRNADNNLSDVTLSGKIHQLEAQAKSGFGFTTIDVTMKVGFDAKNTSDGSTVRMVLGANGTDTVGAFEPEDLKALTNDVARELFDQLFRDLTVKDRAFHLRSNQTP